MTAAFIFETECTLRDSNLVRLLMVPGLASTRPRSISSYADITQQNTYNSPARPSSSSACEHFNASGRLQPFDTNDFNFFAHFDDTAFVGR